MAARSRLHKAGSGVKKFNRLTTVTTPKFRVGQMVTVVEEDGSAGFGKIRGKEFVWHPEYWGGKETDDPEWVYTIEAQGDSLDISGIWRESDVEKYDPKDW